MTMNKFLLGIFVLNILINAVGGNWIAVAAWTCAALARHEVMMCEGERVFK